MTQLEPGPELDALVAEKVMGWSYQTFPEGQLPDKKHWYSTSPCPNDPTHESHRGRVCHYSTNIADAWKVVEKMQTMNRQQDIHIQSLYGKWDVSMCYTTRGDGDIEWGDWIVDAETAPHAICLAALKAVGVDIPTPAAVAGSSETTASREGRG